MEQPLLFLFWREGSNLQQFLFETCMSVLISNKLETSAFSDVKHCSHVEHCFFLREAQASAKHSSDVKHSHF